MKNVKITGRYKIWYLISAVIIVAGLIFGMMNGLNYGIEYTSGTMLRIDIGQPVVTEDIQALIEPFDLNAQITTEGVDHHQVVLKTQKALDNDERMAVFNVFKEEYNLENDALKEAVQYAPQIGSELRNNALLSILIASVVMLAYISFRFQVSYGISAIIALVHDILVLLSIYAIFGLTINSSFIAAILTIVGYSINDTIVVFDRVRENGKRMKKSSLEEVADVSIQQTLRRSINTSLTTLLVIGSLYFLGMYSIKEFALPLMCGVFVGTYSSIFIASPTWSLIKDKMDGTLKKKYV